MNGGPRVPVVATLDGLEGKYPKVHVLHCRRDDGCEDPVELIALISMKLFALRFDRSGHVVAYAFANAEVRPPPHTQTAHHLYLTPNQRGFRFTHFAGMLLLSCLRFLSNVE